MLELHRFARKRQHFVRNLSLPPSSSGPGRGPFKAKTRVRIPLGAYKKTCQVFSDYYRQPGRSFCFYALTLLKR